jgi:hypothetical protein
MQLKANILRGDISNTCALETRWKFAKDSNGKTSTNLWKWRNTSLGMHTAGCHQQDVVQQFNVNTSTINRLLSRFRVTRQVSALRRRWCQLKTAFHLNCCIVKTSRRNCFVSVSKAANELHPTSGVGKSDQSVKTGCYRMSIYAREDLVLRYIWLIVIVKLTLPGQPPVYTGLCCNGMLFCLLTSRFQEDFADRCVCVWRGWIELFHPKRHSTQLLWWW